MKRSGSRRALRQSLLLVVAPCGALVALELFQARSSAAGGIAYYSALAGAAIALLVLLAELATNLFGFFEARASSAALHSRDEQFRLLVEGVGDYAIYMLDTQGRVASWNPGAQRIKGYSAEEIMGEPYSRFFTEEDRNAGVPQRILEAAARDGRFESEAWRVRKDGTRFYVSAVLTALHDSSGQLIGFAKVTRDVTERLQQQRALEQAHAALAQSQKIEALGQLTGGVAHDFNNILHVIGSTVTALRNGIRAEDTSSLKYLEMARRNVERGSSITHRLLAFSRQQPLAPKPLDANRLLQNMSDFVRQAVGEGVAIETVFSSGLWTAWADINQLETAILNLALNSRDAMNRSGKLTLETANALLDETYVAAHPDVKSGQYVMIAVSDTGTGMSKEVLERAFEPFFTTKSVGEGTGLGLSQVFGFVKQSGGHVKIYTETGQGTTVKIYLPRLRSVDAPYPAEAAAVATPTHAQSETILLVEDHEDARVFTAEMLRALGYRVAEAADGASALRALEQLGHVDLLFTDVGLPGNMNGRQLADEALKQQADLRVLYTTGYARNAIIHHGRLDYGVQLLTKPFTQPELARRVRQVLDGE
jgi:PAS domain S-box-containing protein